MPRRQITLCGRTLEALAEITLSAMPVFNQTLLDFRRCLEVQLPYLGQMTGVYTDWNPLTDRQTLFAEDIDRRDPWQFANILVK